MGKHFEKCGQCSNLGTKVEIYKSPYGKTEVLGRGKIKARIVKYCRANLSSKCFKK